MLTLSLNGRVYSVTNEGRPIAEIHLDYCGQVVVAVHGTVEEAIEDTVSRVGVPGLRYEVRVKGWRTDEVEVRFFVGKPNRFAAWKSESVSSKGSWDLSVVPSYHPVMKGKKGTVLVNGDTDALIRGNAVTSIHAPEAARANRHTPTYGGSWTHVKHPFYAVGRSMRVSVHVNRMRSREGVEELMEILRAALGQNNLYLEVSGGFRAPLKCGHNRLLEIGRHSPWPKADYTRYGNVARGSEEHCVWAYRVLEAEGVLAKSHIPSWFLKEGWLGIYQCAEVRHGLF